jgi:hypothetical protein
VKGALFQAAAIKLWVSGLSSGQIAAAISAEIGEPVTRNRVVGVIFRAGKRLLAETGCNPYARPDHSHSTRNGLRHLGREPRAPKPERPRQIRRVNDKPAQIKREIDFAKAPPGDRLPPLVKLDERLWISLPGTDPKDILSLSSCECRWPLSTGVHNVGDGAVETLFCGEKQADNSSYCPTHTRWSRSNKPLAPLNFGKAA